MKTYSHVATVTREVHDALMRWARRLLQEADMDTVQVYGQFPPSGTVASHLVLFPYRVGPDPKMVESAPGVSLLTSRAPAVDRVGLIPRPWLDLGEALAHGLDAHFRPTPQVGGGRRSPGDALPYPRVAALPEPLRAWYERISEAQGADSRWVVRASDELYAIPPALTWRPGIVVTARYIAVVGEPGRGTSEGTSASAPIGLAALSVLTAGLHLENTMQVRLAPLPCEPELVQFTEALAASTGDGTPARLTTALEATQREGDLPVSIFPMHDLTNHEFALLMQALQKPLQAALNLQLRLQLAAQVLFAPSLAVQVNTQPGTSGVAR